MLFKYLIITFCYFANLSFAMDQISIPSIDYIPLDIQREICSYILNIPPTTFNCPSYVTFIVYDPSGKQMALALENEVRIVDSKSMQTLRTFDTPGQRVVRYSPDGAYLVLSNTNELTIFNAHTLQPIKVITFIKEIDSIAYSPDGLQLAVCGMSLEVTFFDTKTWQKIKDIDCTGIALTYSPNGEELAVMKAIVKPNNICMWNTKTWQEIKRYSGIRLRYNPNGKQLVLNGIDDSLSIIDPSSENILHSFNFPLYTWGENAAYSPDGTQLAVLCRNGDIKVYDTYTWQEIGLLHPDKNIAGSMRFLTYDPSGFILSSMDSYDKKITFYDVRSLTLPQKIKDSIKTVRQLIFVTTLFYNNKPKDIFFLNEDGYHTWQELQEVLSERFMIKEYEMPVEQQEQSECKKWTLIRIEK